MKNGRSEESGLSSLVLTIVVDRDPSCVVGLLLTNGLHDRITKVPNVERYQRETNSILGPSSVFQLKL